MKSPTQCHLWQKEALTADDLYISFVVLERFVDEPHHSRSLRQCKQCRQLYFHEFDERIDWDGGNDPQFQTYIPVESREEAEALLNSSGITRLKVLPRLHSDFPKDAQEAKVFWVRGPAAGQ